MDKGIIEDLKTNELRFSSMPVEWQAGIKKALGVDGDVIFYNSQCREWREERGDYDTIDRLTIYRLRPDYQEQPSIIECEVVNQKEVLGYKKGVRLFYGIQSAINDPDFIGFKYEDGKTYPHSRLYMRGNSGRIVNVTGVDFGFEKDIRVLTPTHVVFRNE